MSQSGSAPAPPTFRRLLPDPTDLTAAEALDAVDPISAAPAHRPYTLVNFVTALDGRVALDGRSAPLSDPGDRAIFHELRERVDAVLAGGGTMGEENYGRLVRDPARRARRAGRGLAPDPLAALVTRSGEVPTDIPLLSDPHSRVVIFAARAPTLSATATATRVETVLVDPGALTLTTALRRLRSDYDVRALLCEGGPTLFSGMLAEGLVDELFLTLSPWLGGGAEPALTAGPPLRPPVGFELAWVLERESTLFLRYRRRRETG